MYNLELNTAISPRDLRMKTLFAALREFNHNDPSKHDQELDLHADKIIFQKLAFCYSVRKFDEELGLLACVMEMVYRANRARVAISFHDVGESLLPLLVDMMKNSAPRRRDALLAERHAIAQKEMEDGEVDLHSSNKSHNPLTQNIYGSKAKSSLGKKFLPTVSEEKKGEKGDDDDENENITACSSNDVLENNNTMVSTFASATSKINHISSISSDVPIQASQKRQVRFSDAIEVEELEIPVKPKDREEEEVQLPLKEITHPMAVKKAIKILRYFSRVLTAMIPMAHFPGLLDELVFNLRIPANARQSLDIKDENDDENSYHSAKTEMSWESDYADAYSAYSVEDSAISGKSKRQIAEGLDTVSRIDTIATIVNLACAEGNKSKLFNHPGLLDAVICVARDDPINEAREHASIVLMNLALEDSNKV